MTTGHRGAPGPGDAPGPPAPVAAVRAWWQARPLLRYVSAFWVAGAATVAGMAVLAARGEVAAWQVLAVAALFTVADLQLLETRSGHTSEAFTFAELCLVLSLVLAPTPVVVVVGASSVLAFHLLRRVDAVKATFNAANVAVAVAVAGGVLHVVGSGPAHVMTPRNVAGLVLATAAFFVVNSLAVAGAVARARGVTLAEVYRPGLLMRALVCGGNAAVALSILLLAQWSRPAVLVLPPVLVLLYASYRGYLHAAEERDVWQQLEKASRELNRLDERGVAEAAIVRAAQLLKADEVDIVLGATPGGAKTRYVGDATGLRAPADVAPASWDVDAESRTTYARTLDGPHGTLGLLRVSFGGPVRLTRRERQVLQTFAGNVATTLENARLYAEMREQAELKSFEASHDGLTRLANRSLLAERAGAAVDAAQGTTAL